MVSSTSWRTLACAAAACSSASGTKVLQGELCQLVARGRTCRRDPGCQHPQASLCSPGSSGQQSSVSLDGHRDAKPAIRVTMEVPP